MKTLPGSRWRTQANQYGKPDMIYWAVLMLWSSSEELPLQIKVTVASSVVVSISRDHQWSIDCTVTYKVMANSFLVHKFSFNDGFAKFTAGFLNNILEYLSYCATYR